MERWDGQQQSRSQSLRYARRGFPMAGSKLPEKEKASYYYEVIDVQDKESLKKELNILADKGFRLVAFDAHPQIGRKIAIMEILR